MKHARTEEERMGWEDIGPLLTKEGIHRLNVGSVLRFKKDNFINELKVMRMSKKKQRVWIKQIKTYTVDEVESLGKG